jgi:hypothetical protein
MTRYLGYRRRLAKVNDLENREAVFTDYGGVMGAQAPIEGGSGKAVGFAAWGKAFPRLIILFLVDDRILIFKH